MQVPAAFWSAHHWAQWDSQAQLMESGQKPICNQHWAFCQLPVYLLYFWADTGKQAQQYLKPLLLFRFCQIIIHPLVQMCSPYFTHKAENHETAKTQLFARAELPSASTKPCKQLPGTESIWFQRPASGKESGSLWKPRSKFSMKLGRFLLGRSVSKGIHTTLKLFYMEFLRGLCNILECLWKILGMWDEILALNESFVSDFRRVRVSFIRGLVLILS